eukprot:Nitzschia sp. Nitz4//scaffold38_size140716//106606//107985//NITZ4_003159-RA/size140716-processed-gene-0.40-mRNA-1//1//CDS//3329550114//6810//frame0
MKHHVQMKAEEGDLIAECALKHFSELPTRAKPRENCEWTVFAAIVAVRQDHPPRVVSSATGTKCTTNRMKGCVLHDSHAEVLARRGLMRTLWLELVGQTNSVESDKLLLEASTTSEKHRLRADTHLFLYVSDSPCGDASIYATGTEKDNVLFTGAKVIVSGNISDVQDTNHKLLEGTSVAREQTQELGKLRTKSGRSNLPSHLRSTSMSCSDKVALWGMIGLQGGLLSKYVDPIPLAGVIVSEDRRIQAEGGNDNSQRDALIRAIPERVQETLTSMGGGKCPVSDLPLVHITPKQFYCGKAAVVVTHVRKRKREEDTSNQENPKAPNSSTNSRSMSPSGMSMNWQGFNPTAIELVVGNRGIQQGKKPKTDKDICQLASRLCRFEFLRLKSKCDVVREQHEDGGKQSPGDASFKDYKHCKNEDVDLDWKTYKNKILSTGKFVGWIRNEEDGDFSNSSEQP